MKMLKILLIVNFFFLISCNQLTQKKKINLVPIALIGNATKSGGGVHSLFI